MTTRPFAQAAEQNKHDILAVLQAEFAETARVLEIGSGTGQHAAYFARYLPHLVWQPADLSEHHGGIQAWVEWADRGNLPAPITLDVEVIWPSHTYDGVFSANTVHIMSWPQIEAMFRGLGRVLAAGGVFCLYGPFSYNGAHTSASNARFDQVLRARDPDSGLRDVEALQALAHTSGITLMRDHAMRSNNRTLVWHKTERRRPG